MFVYKSFGLVLSSAIGVSGVCTESLNNSSSRQDLVDDVKILKEKQICSEDISDNVARIERIHENPGQSCSEIAAPCPSLGRFDKAVSDTSQTISRVQQIHQQSGQTIAAYAEKYEKSRRDINKLQQAVQDQMECISHISGQLKTSREDSALAKDQLVVSEKRRALQLMSHMLQLGCLQDVHLQNIFNQWRIVVLQQANARTRELTRPGWKLSAFQKVLVSTALFLLPAVYARIRARRLH